METKLREVKIEEYWPLIVKNTAEFGQIAVAENPEFNNLAECIYRVLCDSFIDADMTEYGVSRWEKMLGITPAEGSSLDDRKAAILTQLSVKIPYTWRVLKQMLVPILGGEDKFEMSLNNEMGELDIKFKIPVSETPMEAIEQLMERVLPMNLVTVYDYDIETLMKILNDGLAEMLGEGQFVLEYISDEKKVVAHTDRVDELTVTAVENLLGRVLPQNIEVVQYNHNIELSWRDMPFYMPLDRVNKYDSCVTRADILAIDSDYVNDYYETSASPKTFAYFFSNLENWGANFGHTSSALYFWAYLPKIKTAKSLCEVSSYKHVYLYMPECTRIDWFLYESHNVVTVEGNFDAVTHLHVSNFSSKMKHWRIALPSLSSSSGLIGTQLDKESALCILNSIPAYTSGSHTIQIGIHVDLKTSEEVLAAIANAEAKGWTLTVQWKGTPTSTASVMRFGQLIYARVSETERPDGTTDRYLDWGHYVTHPEEYETFRSLESAYRYFNLEMPEYE